MPLSPFGALLHQLRAETGTEKLSDQAAALGVSARYLSTVAAGLRKPDDSWGDIICKRYGLTRDEYDRRLAIVSGSEDVFASTPQLSPFGKYLQRICETYQISIQQVSKDTGYVVSYLMRMIDGSKEATPALWNTFKKVYPLEQYEYYDFKASKATSVRPELAALLHEIWPFLTDEDANIIAKVCVDALNKKNSTKKDGSSQ